MVVALILQNHFASLATQYIAWNSSIVLDFYRRSTEPIHFIGHFGIPLPDIGTYFFLTFLLKSRHSPLDQPFCFSVMVRDGTYNQFAATIAILNREVEQKPSAPPKKWRSLLSIVKVERRRRIHKIIVFGTRRHVWRDTMPMSQFFFGGTQWNGWYVEILSSQKCSHKKSWFEMFRRVSFLPSDG